MSSVVANYNFLLKVRRLVVPHLRLLSKSIWRSQILEKVAAIDAMPQFSSGDINNNSIDYMYIFLAFVVSDLTNSITVAVLCTQREEND